MSCSRSLRVRRGALTARRPPAILGFKRLGQDMDALAGKPLTRYATAWWLWPTRDLQPIGARPALVPLNRLLRACGEAAAEIEGARKGAGIASASPII